MLKQLSRKTVYSSEWIKLHVDRVETEDGSIIEKYHQLDYPKGSIVVIVENKGKICFIKSFRYTTQQYGIELPAGYVEENEELEIAAVREVYEETGLNIDKPEFLFNFLPSNGMSNQVVNVFYAKTDDELKVPVKHEGIVDVFWYEVDKLKELIETNKITDGITLLALTRYLLSIYH